MYMKMENSPINVVTRAVRKVVEKVDELTTRKNEENKAKNVEKERLDSIQGTSRFLE